MYADGYVAPTVVVDSGGRAFANARFHSPRTKNYDVKSDMRSYTASITLLYIAASSHYAYEHFTVRLIHGLNWINSVYAGFRHFEFFRITRRGLYEVCKGLQQIMSHTVHLCL